jgi:plasmid stabilization system protein ParE
MGGTRRSAPPVRGYLIFYRVEANEAQIPRVLHGARDYERVLFPDD